MTPVAEAFVWFARRYARARRRADEMAAQGNRDEIENSIGAVQEIEQEVGEAFILVRRPEGMGAPR